MVISIIVGALVFGAFEITVWKIAYHFITRNQEVSSDTAWASINRNINISIANICLAGVNAILALVALVAKLVIQ